MLDKVEPPTIPEGYAMSVAFHCLLDLVRGITTMIEGELGEAETVNQTMTETTSLPAQASERQDLQSVSDQSDKELGTWKCKYYITYNNFMYSRSKRVDALLFEFIVLKSYVKTFNGLFIRFVTEQQLS